MPGPLDWLRSKLAPSQAAEFSYARDHPRAAEHDLIAALLVAERKLGGILDFDFELERTKPGRRILASDDTAAASLTMAMHERFMPLFEHYADVFSEGSLSLRGSETTQDVALWIDRKVLSKSIDALLARPLAFRDAELTLLLDWPNAAGLAQQERIRDGALAAVERHAADHALSDTLRAALDAAFERYPPECISWDRHRAQMRRIELLTSRPRTPFISPGEAWSDAAIQHITAGDAERTARWSDLIEHCTRSSAARPSKKWLTTARRLMDEVGREEIFGAIAQWFPLVDRRPTVAREFPTYEDADPNELIDDLNEDVLKGLAWRCATLDEENVDVSRALTALALSAYRKVKLKGPRAVKVGNACLLALAAIPGFDGVGRIALLKVRVRARNVQKAIEKALTATAERLGLSASELEEMAVPSYGLTAVGTLIEDVGDHRAELRVVGTNKTTLTWSSATQAGTRKSQKSVPVAVKRDHADELKELKSAAKDIQKMLPAQRDRIDALFITRRTWPFATWRERYLDHPLVGTLARRIIWTIDDGDDAASVCWSNGALTRVDGTPLGAVGDDATVTLWHPIEHAVDDVLAWREWLERHDVVQPFKQAHREVYLLTDAERTTGVYSNRFASHVLKQHQFHALCAVRGWKNRLRMMVDDEYPPAVRDLPEWGLRAEYWIEGIGDDWGMDTNEAGSYLRVATDQVRFYPIDAAMRSAHAGGGGYETHGVAGSDTPIPLEDVPPLVLSEILRDVDLFVGVASVGNDPTWQDGGPEGRYRTYWENYSFGDLSGTAQTRKVLLERLVPRLKIAERCTVTDRFLEVRGNIRGYRIHLGSGNILMTPNDQYLCIVPGRGAVKGEAGKVLLPFEGDRTLSVILSKAFLLAADHKITDTTIISQIGTSRIGR